MLGEPPGVLHDITALARSVQFHCDWRKPYVRPWANTSDSKNPVRKLPSMTPIDEYGGYPALYILTYSTEVIGHPISCNAFSTPINADWSISGLLGWLRYGIADRFHVQSSYPRNTQTNSYPGNPQYQFGSVPIKKNGPGAFFYHSVILDVWTHSLPENQSSCKCVQKLYPSGDR